MIEDIKNEKEPLKVFFIISNHSFLDNVNSYSIEKYDELERLLYKSYYYYKEDFTVSIYYFSFFPQNLEESDRDKDTNKFKAKITLKSENNTFYGFIFFDKSKNNYIYDFKFEDIKENNNTISPPKHINFSKLQQLKLFLEFLKKEKIKIDNSLYTDLIKDSIYYLDPKNSDYYFFDYYLEILKMCYATEKIKRLLVLFKLDRVRLPENLIIEHYSGILTSIETKPEIITKKCKENDDQSIFLKLFFRILLYFKANYQKEKVKELLNNKDLWNYYINIILQDYNSFPNIDVPEELINEILKQKNISYAQINGMLSYFRNYLDKILVIINNNINPIFECLLKQHNNLKITEFQEPKEKDILTKIAIELEKLLNYQSKQKEKCIIFENKLLERYIQLFKKEGIENNIIENIISLSTKNDKNIEKSLNLNRQISLNLNSIIEKRIVVPVIGNISTGKSTFCNAFLGNDFCQVKNGITTTFILFIRHIYNLKEPRLYKLNPIKNKINNSYDFERNSEIIVGDKNIKDKIEEINNKCKNGNEPIFYMLEIEIKCIKNKEFLNKVDFLDVPGLNETSKDYIELYFKYIKDMIKYCLIVFSTENYHSQDSMEVIKKVKNNIYVPIKNFLLILNKIDKAYGEIDKTIYNFKKTILNYYDFNCYDNTIVPINSLKLKSELLKENDFYHYLNYYFFKYYEYIASNKNNKVTFIDFIKNEIIKIINLEQNKESTSNEFKNFNDIILENIKNLINIFIEEKKNKGYSSATINTDDSNDLAVIKYFYICFNKKLKLHEDSNSIKEINKYFDQIKDYSFPKRQNNEIIEKDKLIYNESKEHKILNKLSDFYEYIFNSPQLKKYGVIVDLLNKDFEILKYYSLNSSLLFIPVLGVSNSGKSSFINCFLKKDILTIDSNECTRRGIIIKYIKDKDKSYIYSIKFRFQENNTFGKYYYYTKEELLSNNIEQIKELIKILNDNFPQKEEDSFLLLETNIPVLDDLNLDSDIKNNICFIDFPGHNTQNNFFSQNKIYQEVLKMSSFFIYMNNGKAFKENSNKELLSNLFKEVINIRKGDITPNQFLDSCLFVFNKSDSLEPNEKNLEGIEEEIKEIIGIKDNESKISCSLFSSLNYNNYRKIIDEFKIENTTLVTKYSEFKEQLNKPNDLIGLEIEKDFLNDLYIKLKNMKPFFDEFQPLNNEDKETTKSLKKIIEDFYAQNKLEKSKNFEENILNISKLLNDFKENREKLVYFKQSYASETFEKIKNNIIKSSNLKKDEFINHLDRIFYFMNIFFRIENIYINKNANFDFKTALNEVLINIEAIFNNFKPEEYFEAYKQEILQFIEENKNTFNVLDINNKKKLKGVVDYINKVIEQKIIKLKEELEKNYLLLQEKISEEMKKLGINRGERLDNNKKKNLFKKKKDYGFIIKMSTSLIISFPFLLVYAITWEFPNWIIKNIKKKFESNETKFKVNLEKIKKKINKQFDETLKIYKNEYIKIKNNTIKTAESLLGLIKANSVETDGFWEEAKKEYIKIKKEYIKIKK